MNCGRRDVKALASGGALSRVTGILALACLPAATALPQQYAPPILPTTIQHVRGVVVNSLDLKPIARTLVTSGDQRWAAMTDDQGRFSFDMRRPVPPPGASGSQSMASRRMLPYSMAVYLLARKPGYTNRNVNVQIVPEDQGDTEVTVKMVPECVLRGHVSAAGGDLPAGTYVQLRHKTVQDGTAVWLPANGAQVNSRGEFRVAELQPGDYKVMVPARTVRAVNQAQSVESTMGYLPAFNGDAIDLDSAVPIHLNAGQTAEANIDMRAATFYKVSVPVVHAATVAASGGVSVIVGADGSSGFSLQESRQTQRLEGMLPNGAYDIRVTSIGGLPPNQVVTEGHGRVEVQGGLVKTGTITLAPLGTIPVIVHEEYSAQQANDSSGMAFSGPIGRAIRAMPPVNISLRQTGFMGRGAGLRNILKPDDPLVVENVAEGTYIVQVSANRGYVAAVSANGIDLLRQPLVVAPGGGAGPIEVTVRDDGAKLTGTLAAGTEPPSESVFGGINVMCIPLGNSFAHPGFAGITPGGFNFQNLAPGQYLVLASHSQTLYQSIEFRNENALRELQSKGTVVTLAAGQKATIQVPLMPDEED